MPASDAIARRAKPIIITRASDGEYVDGIWQPGSTTTVPIKAAIQPLGGRERNLLPEGIRESGKWRVWSRSQLVPKDRLNIEGTDCVLLSAEKWNDYWRAVAGDADGST